MTIVTPEYQNVTILTEHFTAILISDEETYLKMLHTLIIKLRSCHMFETCLLVHQYICYSKLVTSHKPVNYNISKKIELG